MPDSAPHSSDKPVKKQFVSRLSPGEAVSETFFLREIEERSTRDGRPFLALKLSDRTGILEGRMWGQTLDAGNPAPLTFVRIEGRVERYRGRLRLLVEAAGVIEAAGLNQRDFLPGSYRSTEEMTGFLSYFLTEVFDEDYQALLQSFFSRPGFMEKFSLAPGDVRSHHAYLGGLLEHTVSVATLCQHTAVQHPRLNSDLLITAALLHDIGKIEEFCYEGRISLSREGKLLGHVLIGQRMIEQRLREELPDFPREKELQLVHAVISHHGELEWGAPKRPQSAEALVLHHVDNLDARVKGFFEVLRGKGELSWPEVRNYFRRPLDEPAAADREPGYDRG